MYLGKVVEIGDEEQIYKRIGEVEVVL